MHEGPKFEKKNSAEQPYLIEKLDPEMRAAKFVLDPQEYINQYHDYLQSVHSNESDYAVLAISEIYELESVVLHSDYTELHPDLESFWLLVQSLALTVLGCCLPGLNKLGILKNKSSPE